jgi:hypothetical protein
MLASLSHGVGRLRSCIAAPVAGLFSSLARLGNFVLTNPRLARLSLVLAAVGLLAHELSLSRPCRA